MPEYRRHRVPGGTYFFTLALADRRSDLLVREIAALRAAGWRDDRPVWTGSCPCQPFSAAGKQVGVESRGDHGVRIRLW